MDAHGTELMAMQTKPPSWSVAAIRRWRDVDRIEAIRERIASGDEALWLRFTTSSPPNCRCLQSLSTTSVSGPWNPTIITSPISSSSVSPPGPSCWVGEAGGTGVGTAAVELELEPAHETEMAATASSSARRRTTNLLTPTAGERYA